MVQSGILSQWLAGISSHILQMNPFKYVDGARRLNEAMPCQEIAQHITLLKPKPSVGTNDEK